MRVSQFKRRVFLRTHWGIAIDLEKECEVRPWFSTEPRSVDLFRRKYDRAAKNWNRTNPTTREMKRMARGCRVAMRFIREYGPIPSKELAHCMRAIHCPNWQVAGNIAHRLITRGLVVPTPHGLMCA